MAKRYGAAHRRERKAWAPIVASGQAECAEVVCLMPSRRIYPGTRWHLAHDPTGLVVIGVSHGRCNEHEAAVRGNRMRGCAAPALDFFE